MKERTRIGLLFATAALVYANALRDGFTLDDDLYITLNPQVTKFTAGGLFALHKYASVFRPVTFGTFAINWALSGAHPFGFHLVNLALHAAVTCLLYLLLRTILEPASPQGKNVAFVAALLFAVHPIHTEAVTSIVGRSELLAAGFLLAACLLHLNNREIPALLCFMLAVMSKESAVLFLPLVIVCDYARDQWKPILRYVWIAGVTLLYLGVFWKLQGGHLGQRTITGLDNPLAALSARWRILNALRVAWKYVALQIYPRTLSCDYSFNQIPVYSDWSHTLPAAAAELAVFAGWIWAVRKHHTSLVLAGGIYLTGFAVSANVLTPIGTIMGERLAYFPSAGFCLLVAAGWVWLLGYCHRDGQRILAFGLLATVVVALGVRTAIRNLDWKNNRTLFSSAVIASPGSAKSLADMGDLHRADGQLELAQAEYQKALEIYPNYPDVLESAGLLQSKLGHFQAAGQMMEKAFYTSARNNINYDFMAVNLAALYIQTDHMDGALDLLNREIAEAPEYDRAWSNRAVIHYKLNDANAARTDAEAALRLDPGNTQAQNVIRLLNTSSSR